MQGILLCERYNKVEVPDEIMKAPLSDPFFTRRMKMLIIHDGFMLYGNLGVDFFSISSLLCPI